MDKEQSVRQIYSFPPISAADARLLILGSMPGKVSLAAAEYYAHPRNLFWPILGELVGAAPALDYAERSRILKAHGIALWDVLESCRRDGSLDTNIDKSSMVANDFAGFFSAHPHIGRVFFNGVTAEQTFRKQVLPVLDGNIPVLQRLPSTSPAHAALSFAEKLQSWRSILEPPPNCDF
ncbi:MAG: DNA-deoxyinosine glycosylase [Methylococcales bacterium]|nr:DNA-deoxyinosine glycosylase [Methylococcales bacterium]